MLYRRHYHGLYTTAYRRLENREAVEDILQEVFLRLWRRRDRLEIADPAAYLFTAVRYEVLNHLSRNKAPLAFYAPFEAMLLESETPEDRLIAKELFELIHKYAETLPDRRKQVFLLHINSRLSVQEIAEQLNTAPKTVHNHLGIAMKGLRTHIAPAIALVLCTRW
jgi:RNA polymerase sigma-70 factor (ECF subfamily)